MSKLRTKELNFYSSTSVRNSQGKSVETVSVTPIPIKCSVQPASSEMIKLLPENLRKSVNYEIWTSTNLVIEPDSNTGDDIGKIEYLNENYRIHMVFPWKNTKLKHNVYAMSRIIGK